MSSRKGTASSAAAVGVRGAEVSHEIGDGHIHLMAYGADDRDF